MLEIEKPGKLSFYSDETLFLFDSKTRLKAYDVSILGVLTALITLMSLLCFFDVLPIPSGLFILYIFRRFEKNSVNALLLSNMLILVSVVFYLNIIRYLLCIFDISVDLFTSYVFMRSNFNFDRKGVLKIGGMYGIVTGFIVLLLSLEPIFVLLSNNPYINQIQVSLVISLVIILWSMLQGTLAGLLVLMTFNALKTYMDQLSKAMSIY